MEKENLPGNSYSSKSKKEPKVKVEVAAEEPAKVKKVVKGEVIQKKKGLGSKIAETFTGDDAHSVGSYILFDVIIPAAKNMLADAVSQGSERLLFGDTRSRNRVSARTGSTRSYGSMYKRDGGNDSRRSMTNRERSTHDFDGIVIAERGEAEEVIEQLIVLIEDYDHAKVSDLYAMVGITGTYTDDKWGWTNLSTASTTRVRQGYVLELPKPVPID